jgi:transcriptional regulator with XRE-family HTH domain
MRPSAPGSSRLCATSAWLEDLSLEALALRSKIDKAALSRLEAGKQSNPTIATLLRYARALDLRLNLSLDRVSGDPETAPERSGEDLPAGRTLA